MLLYVYWKLSEKDNEHHGKLQVSSYSLLVRQKQGSKDVDLRMYENQLFWVEVRQTT